MRHLITAITIIVGANSPAADDDNWNQFRGSNGNGISTATKLPVEFDEAKNVRWKTAIPDEGWSSPVVWGNEIWLTTGSDETRELRAICVDLDSGSIVRDIKVFDMIERKVDAAYKHDSPHLNSPATPTPVVEDEHVFVHFGSQGIACLERKTGDRLWERRDLRIYQPVRQGSSPIVDDQSLYVAYDGTDRQFFIALDKETGETRWKKDRNIETDWEKTLRERGLTPKKGGGGKPGDHKKSFATATLIESDGQRQLIAPAGEATIAYNPETGEEIWRVLHPGGFNVSARPLHAHGMIYVFTSGLTGHLLAVRTDGSGDVTDTHVAWSTTRSTPHIPSPVIVDDLLFMVTDKGGIVRCIHAVTGDEIWRKRIGGNHWASPLYSAGKLYFFSKEGDVAVLPASREEPEIVAKNRLDASFIASPAVAGSSLILRSTTHLYCLANGYERSEQDVAADVYPDSKVAARSADSTSDTDWDAAYAQLLKKDPGVRAKVESGQATKEDVIAWMKTRSGEDGRNKELTPEDMESLAAKLKEAVQSGRMTAAEAGAEYERAVGKRVDGKSDSDGKGKDDKRGGATNFYAIVIGRLKTKDIELGEFTMDVDHVTSMYSSRWVKDEIVGKTVTVTGVLGQFSDQLLLIKRGESLKVRSGGYLADSNTLTFAPKFHVLERAQPFSPDDYGVPPEAFRGFQGELQGKIVEVGGYEVTLRVEAVTKLAENNRATDAESIIGKLVRLNGFYRQHEKAFQDLHVDDTIRVGAAHANPTHDEMGVTDVLEKLEQE